MKKLSTLFLIFGTVLLVVTNSLCEETTNFAYLRNSIGAKPVSMGEASGGLADDVYSIFYNPAGISFVDNYSLLFSHIEFFQGIRYEITSGIIPVSKNTSIGISAIYINNGLQEKRDISGNPGGEFAPYQIIPIISFGKNLTSEISIGANVKIPYEVIDDYSNFKVLFDLAGFFKANSNYSFGINLQNVGVYENLPINLKLGAGYNDNLLKMGFDINIPYKSSMIFNLGGEIKVIENLFLRGGLKYKLYTNFDFISNVTLGFGFKFDIFSIDYGFKYYDELGNTHFVSLVVNFK
ncbi:MAG: PorV/PorQ family protein [Candidatus Firestonebacteria bacterium]